MTGLMYHRPGDHIKYLIDCLQKVHEKGQDNITWSSFVDIRRTKTPLPPIDKRHGSRPNSRTRTPKGMNIQLITVHTSLYCIRFEYSAPKNIKEK